MNTNPQTTNETTLAAADYIVGFDTLGMQYCIDADRSTDFTLQFAFSHGAVLNNNISLVAPNSLIFSGNSPPVAFSGLFGMGGGAGDTQVAFLVQPDAVVNPLMNGDCISLSSVNDDLNLPQNTSAGTAEVTVRMTYAVGTALTPSQSSDLVVIAVSANLELGAGLVISLGALGGVAAIIRRRKQKKYRSTEEYTNT